MVGLLAIALCGVADSSASAHPSTGACPAGRYVKYTFGQSHDDDDLTKSSRSLPTLAKVCQPCVLGMFTAHSGEVTACKMCPVGRRTIRKGSEKTLHKERPRAVPSMRQSVAGRAVLFKWLLFIFASMRRSCNHHPEGLEEERLPRQDASPQRQKENRPPNPASTLGRPDTRIFKAP